MAVRKAKAQWKGDLKNGNGTYSVESGAAKGAYSFGSRFEEGEGSNPEELIGAAHAGCFSMAFANELAKAGFEPESVETEAKVHMGKTDEGPGITRIELVTTARVADIEDDEFQKIAEGAKNGCPVSRALAAVDIGLEAKRA